MNSVIEIGENIILKGNKIMDNNKSILNSSNKKLMNLFIPKTSQKLKGSGFRE